MSDDRESLRAAILAQYPSVYAFTKAKRGAVSKSVVVLLLSGKYPGNVQRQTARAWAALAEPKKAPQGLTQGQMAQSLGHTACAACGLGRRTCRKKRHGCQSLWQAQAAAILSLLEKGA